MSTQDLGAGRVRSKVVITSEPCEDKGPLALAIRTRLLEAIAMQPELTQCGYSPFEKLRMQHNGQAWVVEVEAIMDVPQGGAPSVPSSSAGGGNEA